MTKIPRHHPLWDQCNISMEMLWQRCEEYFKKNHPDIENRFYSDYHKGIQGKWQREGILDVITFGDTIKKMFLSGNYPQQEFRFWNISSAFKRLQDELLFEGKSTVNLIPRYELFKNQESKPIDWNKPVDLIYAGRLSRQKNILSLILFAHELNKLGLQCKLHIFGEFDDRIHEHLGRQVSRPYKKEVEELIASLEGEWKPQFYGHVEREEWLKGDFSSPIAISLSTFIGEDFGVSLAQAQEKGWPVICSAFGGHLDIEGNQVGVIPSHLIEDSPNSLALKKILSKRAALYFLKSRLQKRECPYQESGLTKISQSDCDSLRRNLAETIGPALPWLSVESLDNFADTPMGGLFLQKCVEILEGKSPEEGEERRVIVLGLDARENLDSTETHFIEEVLASLELSQKIAIFYADELTDACVIYQLKRAKKVFLSPKVGGKNKELINKLFS